MSNKPCGKRDLSRFVNLAQKKIPFTFIRFSDGEIEVLKNRRLLIGGGKTTFRGANFGNDFPDYDSKSFEPAHGQELRADLLASACFKEHHYYKGIPTSHNNALIDREFMLRLHGGFSAEITFSDLFINSNFLAFRDQSFLSLVSNFKSIYVICNWRSEFRGPLVGAHKVPVPDNFFENYSEVKGETYDAIASCPEGTLILSSASSLSNTLGFELRKKRPDVTFLDIGTVLNDLLGLDVATRGYHALSRCDDSLISKIKTMKYRMHREYKLRW